jgi:hypothetical protein
VPVLFCQCCVLSINKEKRFEIVCLFVFFFLSSHLSLFHIKIGSFFFLPLCLLSASKTGSCFPLFIYLSTFIAHYPRVSSKRFTFTLTLLAMLPG